MGHIKHFDIKKLKSDFKLTHFFETGTFKGEGVRSIQQFDFEKIYSCEIIEEYVASSRKIFTDDNRVQIFKGQSFEVIHKTTSELDANILFWLDAHFPGADGGLNDFDSEVYEDTKYPLKKELFHLSESRKGYQDFYIIDDLWIYDDSEFEHGFLPEYITPPEPRNFNFVNDYFRDTHTVIKCYDHGGYLVLIPKGLSTNIPFRDQQPLRKYLPFLYSRNSPHKLKIV